MSSNKSSTGDKGKSNNPAKRSKSAGFIESSDFKPNWLETGPLSPDMIQPDLPEGDPPLTQDEFEVLQDSLQRFYEESSVEEGDVSGDSDDTDGIDLAATIEQEPALISEDVPDVALAEVEEDIDMAPLPDDNLILSQESEPEVSDSPEMVASIDEPFAALEEELFADIEAMDHPSEPGDWIAALTEVVEGRPPSTSSLYPVESPAVVDSFDAPDTFVEDEIDPSDETDSTDEPEAIEEPVLAAVAPTVIQPVAKPATRRKTKKRRRRLSGLLLLGSLLLLGAAAIVYFVNPFSRIALGSASLARPISSSTAAAPGTGSGEWCITGDFLPEGAPRPQLIDSGTAGDILAEDLVYSLDYVIPEPGTFEWQVIDCNNESLAYPSAPAWVITREPNQTVTFNFDSTERSTPLFFPIPYVVSALDDTDVYQVVGDFQDWNPDDASGRLQRVNFGLYQQVRRIARAGTYEAYIIAGDETQAVDAYGRTTSPIPFSFQTDRNGEYVVFLVDTDRGRASIMYDMSPFLTSLAYGNGNWILSLTLLSIAGLLLLWMIVRLVLLNTRRLQMESGCPNCGRQELMRISRHSSDRLLHALGIPIYRYRCRHCTWEGGRISEEGVSVSPGLALANTQDF